jgi:hypothetical protein
MCITCAQCGNQSDKFKAIAFELKWLQNYVTDYFNVPEAAITSVSEFVRERKFRHIFFVLASEFSHLTMRQISVHYGIALTGVEMGIKSGRKYKSELSALRKHLQLELQSINIAA